MGVDPNQLLGLITHQNEEEEKEGEEQFYIKDDLQPEDKSKYPQTLPPYTIRVILYSYARNMASPSY